MQQIFSKSIRESKICSEGTVIPPTLPLISLLLINDVPTLLSGKCPISLDYYFEMSLQVVSIHVLHQKFKDSLCVAQKLHQTLPKGCNSTLWLPIDGEIGQKVYLVVYRTETTLLSHKTGGACQGDILFSRHDSYQITQCQFQCMYDSCTCFTYDNETCTTYGSQSTDNGISFHNIQ